MNIQYYICQLGYKLHTFKLFDFELMKYPVQSGTFINYSFCILLQVFARNVVCSVGYGEQKANDIPKPKPDELPLFSTYLMCCCIAS